MAQPMRSPSTGAGRRAGLALLGAGAFAALKNKDKLTSMVKGKSSSQDSAEFTPATAAPTTPVTPVQTTSVDNVSPDTLSDSPSGIRPIE